MFTKQKYGHIRKMGKEEMESSCFGMVPLKFYCERFNGNTFDNFQHEGISPYALLFCKRNLFNSDKFHKENGIFPDSMLWWRNNDCNLWSNLASKTTPIDFLVELLYLTPWELIIMLSSFN